MNRRVFLTIIPLVILLVGATPPQSIREEYPLDDFTVREVMVPMRDGVRLFTIILTPKHARGPLPILMERTPYNASRTLEGLPSTQLGVILGPKHMGGRYIIVTQDIRGRYKSEGGYDMYRVPRGAFNTSATDETTDAWDAIEWLVGHVPGNSGRVGVWGTSYPGWLTLAAMRDPHPALAAAVPFNPVVDVWKADDWFHWGAFRASYAFEFIHAMETRRGQSVGYPYESRDLYAWLLPTRGVGETLGSLLDDRHKMWKRLMETPEYGPYWRDCAADRWFDKPRRLVPTLHVHGYWDQEDIYGAPAVYEAIERHDLGNDLNFFAAGPWYHGQHWADGSALGAIRFDEDTAKRFRHEVLRPFFEHFLLGEAVEPPAPVTVFETGTNRWQEFEEWPPASTQPASIYLHPMGGLDFVPPKMPGSFSEYLSDPAKPVPFTPRPFWGYDYGNPPVIAEWRSWLVGDQRFVDGRPDVVTWMSAPLDLPVTIRGGIKARVKAETSGTDADWIVKLIDVYPDDAPEFEMSGYQLMVSGDIFRGRYRETFEEARPLESDRVLEYEYDLPHINHTFLPGHRLMVQIQSTWFPLYDRNPQTFVPSIMFASESAYRVQRHRIHHGRDNSTSLEILLDSGR